MEGFFISIMITWLNTHPITSKNLKERVAAASLSQPFAYYSALLFSSLGFSGVYREHFSLPQVPSSRKTVKHLMQRLLILNAITNHSLLNFNYWFATLAIVYFRTKEKSSSAFIICNNRCISRYIVLVNCKLKLNILLINKYY